MKKILIIDDDLPYRKIYKRKFEASGYVADTAEDGIVALKKLKEFKPDIALVDLLMPRMDGFQFLDKVKENSEFRKIPMVALTNLLTGEDVEKVREKGAIDYLIKSNMDPDDVVKRVDEILAKKQ